MPVASPPAKLQPSQIVSAIILTFIAGYVDAVGYLRLNGIYVANMSGNSVALGIHLAEGPWSNVLERLMPIGCFVAGLLFSRTLVEVAVGYGMRRIVALALAVEITFLVLFMHAWSQYTGILFAAFGMGIQAALISRFSGLTIYTAFVTGSLVKFAESVAKTVLWLLKVDKQFEKRALYDSIWFFCVWLSYVGGASSGAPAYTSAGVKVILWPSLVLAGLAVLDLIKPTQFNPKAQP